MVIACAHLVCELRDCVPIELHLPAEATNLNTDMKRFNQSNDQAFDEGRPHEYRPCQCVGQEV